MSSLNSQTNTCKSPSRLPHRDMMQPCLKQSLQKHEHGGVNSAKLGFENSMTLKLKNKTISIASVEQSPVNGSQNSI